MSKTHDKAKDKELHEGLKGTFPASDPINVTESTEPDRPVHRKTPVVDVELVDKLADEVERKQKKLKQKAKADVAG